MNISGFSSQKHIKKEMCKKITVKVQKLPSYYKDKDSIGKMKDMLAG